MLLDVLLDVGGVGDNVLGGNSSGKMEFRCLGGHLCYCVFCFLRKRIKLL